VRVHLVNPSSVSFGTAVITPRWQYVLAAATPLSFGDPVLVDETLSQIDPETIQKGDVVGIGIHTANALRGYEIGKIARGRGAYVIFGGVWDAFYSWGSIWKRSSFIKSSKGRLAFLLISRIYRHMYADTGIATDSARVTWSGRWTRWMAAPCRHLFAGRPMPDLAIPQT
jgi:hypothetical protein